MTSMRTPLGRARGLGSAKDGTEHFWRQRLTAVANVPLIVFFVALVVALTGGDHARVAAALGSPWIALPLLLAILSVTVHMRLGMQAIVEDYVHAEGSKVALLVLNGFFAVAVGLAATLAIVVLVVRA